MTAVAVVGERAGRAAVFGVRDRRLSTETTVLVCEVRGKLDEEEERELNAAIRRAVRAQHKIVLGDLWFVRRGWIVTSESGKVAHQATRAKYLESGRWATLTFLPEVGHLGHVGADQVVAVAQAFADRVALMLGLTGVGRGVGVHDDILDLGITSLTATAMVAQIRRERGKPVAVKSWVQNPTCAHLASLLVGIPYPEDVPAIDEAKASAVIAQSAPQDLAEATTVISPQTMAVREPQAVTSAFTPMLNESLGRSDSKPLALRWQQTARARHPILLPISSFVPYGLGVHIQHAWLSQPWVQQRFYASRIKVLATWLSRAGRPLDQTTVLQYLMTNTWSAWRRECLRQPQVRAQWLQVSGAEQLLAARQEGRGTILVYGYTRLSGVLADWALLQNQPVVWIQNEVNTNDTHTLTAQWIRQLADAGEVLEQKGTVMVVGEGVRGSQSTAVELVKGIERPLFHGAAELAIRHRADLIPVRLRLGLDGVVQITLLPRLIPSSEADDPAATLMAAYVEYYRQQWAGELQFSATHYLRFLDTFKANRGPYAL